MGRSPCCSKVGMNRGAWTAFEDKILTDYIKINGEGRWRNLPKRAGLKRCGKSCRLRWLNYLRPGIKRGNISHDEEELIIRLHKLLGNRWSLIAGRLPGRTDNEIKNYWNTALRKKIHDHHNPPSTHKDLNKSVDKEKDCKTESQHVVRTKAMRCTKGYFIPHPHTNEPKQLVVNHNSTTTNPTELGSDYGVTAFTPGEDDPSNFMLDVDIGEVFATDFSGLFASNCDNDNLNNFSPSSNGSLLFSKEMLEDWILSDYVQPNVDSNHHCFASIPEFRDD